MNSPTPQYTNSRAINQICFASPISMNEMVIVMLQIRVRVGSPSRRIESDLSYDARVPFQIICSIKDSPSPHGSTTVNKRFNVQRWARFTGQLATWRVLMNLEKPSPVLPLEEYDNSTTQLVNNIVNNGKVPKLHQSGNENQCRRLNWKSKNRRYVS
ncbi:hypothetical protein BC827DRAFT_1236624 [Russula dissimulans]|nr:hypothetical protein BC827DRAFT_1236624 [Russula dissimulans]